MIWTQTILGEDCGWNGFWAGIYPAEELGNGSDWEAGWEADWDWEAGMRLGLGNWGEDLYF
jgi:hypothetical protein